MARVAGTKPVKPRASRMQNKRGQQDVDVQLAWSPPSRQSRYSTYERAIKVGNLMILYWAVTFHLKTNSMSYRLEIRALGR